MVKKNKSNEEEMEKLEPRQLFLEEPELRTEEEHHRNDWKGMRMENEPEWMTVLKGFMQAQTNNIKGTIVEQGRRLENAEKRASREQER